MNVVAGIRAGACGFKAFPPETFSGSGVGFEPCKMTIAKPAGGGNILQR